MIHLLPYVLAIPITIGALNYRLLPKAGRIFLLILCSYLLVEIASYAAARFFGNNMFVYHAYVPALALMYGFFYYNTVRSPWAQRLIVIVSVTTAVVPIGELILTDQTFFNSISLGVISFEILGFSLYLFYEMALNQVDHKGYWVNIFTFFYFFVSVGYFFAARHLQRTDMEAMILMGYMHAFVNTVCYLGYGYGLRSYAR